MCGIVGFIDHRRATGNSDGRAIVERMSDALLHRGPDAGDTWGDAHAGVFFGHRRLSIQDLSPLGSQPMRSPDGRWTITFNGEIYNFLALRTALEDAGYAFRGHSDTEVLLALFASHGPRHALRAARGMFAVAAWDGHERVL